MHIRALINRKLGAAAAVLSLAGLAAVGASPAPADIFHTFKIISKADSSLCIEAQRDMVKDATGNLVPGPWTGPVMQLCDSAPRGASSMDFMMTSSGELRPVDRFATCLGGGPCAAPNTCIDGSHRVNGLKLLSCNGLPAQRYHYREDGLLPNDNSLCIEASSLTVGAGLVTWGCDASKLKQQWSVKTPDA
jgi:hypothetical protein